MKRFVLGLLRFYINFLSFDRGALRVFAVGPVCKYSPTCSQYTYNAVLKHGILRGVRFGAKRILKCR